MVASPHTERRKFTRFYPKDGTMCVNDHALGPIVNISMGGLAFRYIEDEEPASASESLGVFLGSDDILIDKIEATMVSDLVVSEGTSFLGTPTRQRSIKFKDLTPAQQESIKNFILTKTRGVY